MFKIKEFNIVADRTLDKKTLKHILKNSLHLSDSLISDLKKGDFMFVNGEKCTVRKEIKTGDSIKIVIPETKSKDPIIRQSGNINIICENDDFLIADKPANMPVHPSKYYRTDTLANYICGYMGEDFTYRVITRLDKDTSGAVIIAKNRYSADILNRIMREHKIRKEYLAICDGILKEPVCVEEKIARKVQNGIMRIVSNDGKYAKTEIFPIKNNGENTLLKIIPITGRTHQIRVHLSHIGCPIYSDYLYGKEREGIRTLLHCRKITFENPIDNQKYEFVSDVPEDFFIKP